MRQALKTNRLCSVLMSLLEIYDKKYKQLMFGTFAVIFIALVILGVQYVRTGEFVQKGISLKGGIAVTVPVQDQIDISDLGAKLSRQFPGKDLTTRGITSGGAVTAITVEAADINKEQLIEALETIGITTPADQYSVEQTGSAIGQAFYGQMLKALLIAFIFMAIAVYATFRAAIPSMFVVLAAVSDIICTLAVISLLNVRLSTAGIAAFLMLIGYSVDTDILLTTRVLKRKEGTVLDRILGAMRTGALMTGTGFIATLISYFITQSDVIAQIMLILSIGLFFDFFMTWIQNAGILRWYLERKSGTQHLRSE